MPGLKEDNQARREESTWYVRNKVDIWIKARKEKKKKKNLAI